LISDPKPGRALELLGQGQSILQTLIAQKQLRQQLWTIAPPAAVKQDNVRRKRRATGFVLVEYPANGVKRLLIG
jgi:hypothetical protein